MEPGQAVRHLLDVEHPFFKDIPLAPEDAECIRNLVRPIGDLRSHRMQQLARLRAQADDVKAEADDNNWSDLYRSFGACEYVKFCPG